MTEPDSEYAITYIVKDAMEDDYEQGALLGTSVGVIAQHENITSRTLEGALSQMRDRYCLKEEDLSYLFAGNAGGWFSFNRLETADSDAPDDRETEEWKAGKLKLYLCDYSFHMEHRITRPVGPGEMRLTGAVVEE